ncbi:MAG: DUF962 domain-containing protein [Rhodanobacteraceae bacterium]|nr:DUF962 domain-containing protein [Rhodanobacteraceae bacterium]
MPQAFSSFREFYPYYLAEHSHIVCRRLHYAGSSLALICLLTALVRGSVWWGLAALFCGYGFAWIGHFFFEKNRPATFSYPFYSFAGDWVMLRDMLIGRIQF